MTPSPRTSTSGTPSGQGSPARSKRSERRGFRGPRPRDVVRRRAPGPHPRAEPVLPPRRPGGVAGSPPRRPAPEWPPVPHRDRRRVPAPVHAEAGGMAVAAALRPGRRRPAGGAPPGPGQGHALTPRPGGQRRGSSVTDHVSGDSADRPVAVPPSLLCPASTPTSWQSDPSW